MDTRQYAKMREKLRTVKNRSMTRVQILGMLLLLLLCAAILLFSIFREPRTPFIFHDDQAIWITNPRPVSAGTFLARLGEGPTAIFTRRFNHERSAEAVSVHVRALGEIQLQLNGHAVPLGRGQRACSKSPCRSLVSQLMISGENSIRAHITNSLGPPLFYLRLESPEVELATDERWQVSMDDGPAELASSADDTRVYPGALEATTPMNALRDRADRLVALFAICSLLFLARRRLVPNVVRRHPAEFVLAILSLFWAFLYAAKFVHIPLQVGHDASGHLQYISHILEERSLPLATDGWVTYHPPLFYVAAAALRSIFDPVHGGQGEQWVLKFLPFISGLGMVWVTYALGRRLFGRNQPATVFAVMFAGVLPMNVYMSGYISNEPLYSLLVSVSLLVAARLFTEPRPSIATLVLLSVLLGLTILTKYTGLLVVPIVVFFVAFHMLLARRVSARRVAAISGGILLGVSLIGGWAYLRNWIHFGDPLIWNQDPYKGYTFWQQPGFRTIDYYLGFGESLRHPFYSVFHSFWDAVYSGIWGEGLPASTTSLSQRHELWNYDLMSVGYLLALPATATMLFGFVKATVQSLTGADLSRRLLLSLIVALTHVVSFSLLAYSVRVPYWGNVKATYALCLVVPVAVCAGFGFSTVDHWLATRRRPVLRAVFYGWLGTLVAVLGLSFGR